MLSHRLLKRGFMRSMTILFVLLLTVGQNFAQRKMEYLDRGLVGIKTSPTSVFLSWRLLGTDEYATAFNLYRQYGKEKKTKLNSAPLIAGTNYEDKDLQSDREVTYALTLIDGKKESEVAKFTFSKNHSNEPFLNIPLRTPKAYTPGDVSVGDLDGDGVYELVVHQVGIARDNAHNGITSEPIFQAYKLDGTFLWEINLGKNRFGCNTIMRVISSNSDLMYNRSEE